MLISNQVYIPSFPLSKEKLQTLLQVIGASFLIAFCAQIRIPLFFTPVPLTGHVLAVLFVGALLGSRNGALSVLLYLFEGGILNLPVFSNGNFGFAHFFGPTGVSGRVGY
jgi:biotin transport system substrate-specific component